MAEREGFEPSEQVTPLSGLANRRTRPLCDLSGRKFWLAAAIVALTMPIHPILYGALVKQEALPILVLNLRNALFLVLAAWVVWDLARGGVARPAGLEPTTFRSAT